MRNRVFGNGKNLCFLSLILVFFLLAAFQLPSGSLAWEEDSQHQIEKAKIFREDYPEITESDLYCSFFTREGEILDIKIVAAEKSNEKLMFTNSDIFFINKGKKDGVEIGQIFLIVEKGRRISSPFTGRKLGFLYFKKGKARIVEAGEKWGKAQVEKACGEIEVGDFLFPYNEEELLRKKLATGVSGEEHDVLAGNVIYLERDYVQLGRDQLFLMDLGRDDGLRVGEQMDILRIQSKDLPPILVGDSIVIDTQDKSATAKIRSCRDVVKLGDVVKTKEADREQ